MSTAAKRLPLADAQSLMSRLAGWTLQAALTDAERNAVAAVQVVGSLRRCKATVGDLEVVAPLPHELIPDIPNGPMPADPWLKQLESSLAKATADDDPLFRVINRCVTNSVQPPPQVALFGAAPPEPPAHQRHVFAWAVEGLKPGFRALTLQLLSEFTPGCVDAVRFQIFRATPLNAGWITLMRTGPEEMGTAFLGSWKRRWNIPFGDMGRASDRGHLLDNQGHIVPVATEELAFRLCGWDACSPEQRHDYLERMHQRRKTSQEALHS